MTKLKQLKEWLKERFTKSQWEAAKEISRWLVFLVVSDVAIQLLNQAVVVPEYVYLKVWLFNYSIPARMIFVTGLTLLIRYLDKLKHLNFKEEHPRSDKAGGILPW